jgi:hypothetical protein
VFKIIKDLLNIRLVLEEINPTKMRVIIDETNIVFIPSRGCNGRTPNIRVD